MHRHDLNKVCRFDLQFPFIIHFEINIKQHYYPKIPLIPMFEYMVYPPEESGLLSKCHLLSCLSRFRMLLWVIQFFLLNVDDSSQI